MDDLALDFYYDYTSPFTYLADRRLPALATAFGATLVMKPIGVLGLMKLVGNTPTTACAAKLRYQLDDVKRCAQQSGVALRLNPNVMRMDGRWFARAALHWLGTPVFPALHRRLFDALWLEGAEWPDAAAFGHWLAAVTGEVDAAGMLEDSALGERLRAANAAAAAAGAFGSPTVVVRSPAGAQLYFGNDRLHFVEQHLARVRPVSRWRAELVHRPSGVQGWVELAARSAAAAVAALALQAPDSELLRIEALLLEGAPSMENGHG